MSKSNVSETEVISEARPAQSIEEHVEEAIARNPYVSKQDPEQMEGELTRIEENGERLLRMMSMMKSTRNRFFYSTEGMKSKGYVTKFLNSMKTGLHSMYPILCKGQGCPYSTSCFALKAGIQPPPGDPCVLETDRIERLIERYNDDFDFATSSLTDMLAINELIQLDLLIDRCQKLMAQESLPVIEVNIGVNQHGDPITQPTISKYYEAYERMSKRRSALVDELNASRKARKKTGTEEKKAPWETVLEMAGQDGFFEEEKKPDQFK